MIFALFLLQSISIANAFLNTTNMYDIKTVINSYLSNTIDQHSLHATSHKFMKMVQDESHITSQYFQSVRYIKYGFSIKNETNSTNNNDKVYKKFNFIQSIAFFYCGINMSNVINTSFDNISIDESKLLMNSSIFALQIVESYQLIRCEICERIKLGWYQSVIDLFNPHSRDYSFFANAWFIRKVESLISFTPRLSYDLNGIGQAYEFLAKFGDFEPYKEVVIGRISEIDRVLAQNSQLLGSPTMLEIEMRTHQIKHPKMHKYIVEKMVQHVKSTKNNSFILNHCNSSDFWHHVRMYHHLTGSHAINHQLDNTTVQIANMLQLLDQCQLPHATAIADCGLIVFGMYESYGHENGTDGHEYVINAIKCIISNNHIYCSKFSQFTNGTYFEHFMSNLRESMNVAIFYPYLNELMNDTQFVNIVNNNTDSEMDTYLQTTLSKLMVVAVEEYKDIEMIKKIANVFTPKINVCRKCTLYPAFFSTKIPWMDVLDKLGCKYLTKYFQQRFNHSVDECTSE